MPHSDSVFIGRGASLWLLCGRQENPEPPPARGGLADQIAPLHLLKISAESEGQAQGGLDLAVSVAAQ